MRIETGSAGSESFVNIRSFRFIIISLISFLAIYIVWQKNLSLQERYNIARIENQNKKIRRIADVVTVRFYKNSSILKLQNYAFNDGLTYYGSKGGAKREQRKILKPILIALSGKPASSAVKER
ncbi:MAG: hypothetical protein IEMM0003_0728 [bacterium]|nr:MAG: hypothetical protein IEMM0003_0728 [bacterium]